MTSAQSYPFGIWTPWATIHCPACHEGIATDELKRRYPRAFNKSAPFPTFSHAQARQERPNWTSELGQCDDCTCLVWLDESIAREQWFTRQFGSGVVGCHYGDGFMMQTGGMCSAAGIRDKAKDFYIMVTCEEGIHICAYPNDETRDGEWKTIFSTSSESGPLIYSLAVDAIRDIIATSLDYDDIDPFTIGDVTPHMSDVAECEECRAVVPASQLQTREESFDGSETYNVDRCRQCHAEVTA